MKYFADHMLGRLVVWMRMIGCDVAYDPVLKDEELIDRADREERIILTRDTHLIRRKKVRDNYFFIRGDSYKNQLFQVIKQFSIDPYRGFLTRCLRCNLPLARIEKQGLKERIFPYVYSTQTTFYTCPGCQRIYWPATHKTRMIQQLEEILSEGEIQDAGKNP
ncbi:MAG TPA: Mut7-C RNAse domain-containing protein [Nitrospiria bacterium]|nr:Mut7-C RNAse domain-containing protein [Nitrospiria bacterium]